MKSLDLGWILHLITSILIEEKRTQRHTQGKRPYEARGKECCHRLTFWSPQKLGAARKLSPLEPSQGAPTCGHLDFGLQSS
jgi:hypothetical protein